jgi:hypothetical protein
MSNSPMPDPSNVDRVVDVASVVLISVAAVLTALCGYQSGRWGGQQARLYGEANAARVEAAQASDRANILTAIDVGVFLHYVDAVAENNAREAQFLYQRFRPEMLPAMRAWLAAKPLRNRNAPSSPFVMPQYSLKTRGEARRDETLAATRFQEATEATHHGDDFLLLTVIFAGVSFLAGISTKMVYPRHAIVVAVGIIAMIYGVVRLAALPLL